MENKFCPNCGNKLEADEKFCKHCGHKVDEDVKKVSENAIDKLKTQSKSGVEKVATVASRKTGRNIKPSYVVGLIIVLVVLIGGFFVLKPKTLEGPYTFKTSSYGDVKYITLDFDGNNKVNYRYSTGVEKNGKYKEESKRKLNATYKLDGNKVKIIFNSNKEVFNGTVSNDKGSIDINGSDFKKGDKP